MKPTQILTKLCKDSKIEAPSYMNGTIRVGRKLFRIQSSDNNEEWYRIKGKYDFLIFRKESSLKRILYRKTIIKLILSNSSCTFVI